MLGKLLNSLNELRKIIRCEALHLNDDFALKTFTPFVKATLLRTSLPR